MSKRVACVTMMRNEDLFLKIWHRYYSSQFGSENCFIIDHDSTTVDPRALLNDDKVNIIKIPFQSPVKHSDQDVYAFDRERFAFLSDFVKALRRYYHVVIFNDSDEVFLPDPKVCGSLAEYVNDLPSNSITAGVGIEVFQNIQQGETKYVFEQPLFSQRKYFIYRLHHSKPHIIGKDCSFGGHGTSEPFNLDCNLYLVHLKYLDKDLLISRQVELHTMFLDNRVPKNTRWSFSPQEIETVMTEFGAMNTRTAFHHLAYFNRWMKSKHKGEKFLIDNRPEGSQFYEVVKALDPERKNYLVKHNYQIEERFLTCAV